MSKFESSPVNKAFLRQYSKLSSTVKNPLFMAGVSGGPDSMALLYLLHRHKLQPVVVHCNYGLRGQQSDKDQKMVEQICMMWNLECISVRLEYDSANGGNFQQWARNERYRVFRELKKEYNANFIVTAHHQDDQIETIFQKILRGSGIPAFTGMQIVQDDLFRPLLEVSKDQILDFAEQFNIPYRIDGSNEESTYARNFLRNRWFPMLGNLFPGWRTNLISLTEKAGVHKDLIEFAANQMDYENGSFSRTKFLNLKSSLKPAIFKALFDAALPNKNLNKGLLENIQEIEALQTGQSIDITDTEQLFRNRDRYVFWKDSGSEVSAEELSFFKAELETGIEFRYVKAVIDSSSTEIDPKVLAMDIAKTAFPVKIRNWKNGDQFQPFGMSGSQLVSDHLTNRKIPSHRKKESLVVECFDGMIAAVIFPPEKGRKQPGTISENVRMSETTQQIIKIEIIQ